ncbi:hypothetical protein O6H91_01G117800 [Diphasiastrum complanatum]|uniref:Uncharacterized protein n=1 Tax=Diphasiastrum complanatum TaxID=34168 RepID=A0ACC2EV81_DIPCM|nr:hypothetical protein O6H91_01G117800 [Diphasiastrum complanatum]
MLSLAFLSNLQASQLLTYGSSTICCKILQVLPPPLPLNAHPESTCILHLAMPPVMEARVCYTAPRSTRTTTPLRDQRAEDEEKKERVYFKCHINTKPPYKCTVRD